MCACLDVIAKVETSVKALWRPETFRGTVILDALLLSHPKTLHAAPRRGHDEKIGNPDFADADVGTKASVQHARVKATFGVRSNDKHGCVP